MVCICKTTALPYPPHPYHNAMKNHYPKSPYLFLALTIMQAIHSAEEIAARLYIYLPVVTGSFHSNR